MTIKRSGERRRVASAADVRKNAKDGGGGGRLTKLPPGVRDWFPDKAGRYDINVIPYWVTDANHPDGVDQGVGWYRRSFRVHHLTGQSVVCPKSIKRDAFCPWCRQFFKLKDDGADEETIRPFKGQQFDAFNVLDPDDPEKIAVFSISSGKFWTAKAGLQNELKQADDADCTFFDVGKKGRTLRCRFSEQSFKGKKYLEVTKIDFRKRPPIDPKKIDQAVNLDEFLKVLPKDKLQALFLGADEGDEPKAKKTKGKGISPKRKREIEAQKAENRAHDRKSTKKLKRKKGGISSGPKAKHKCPIKGGRFGRDVDKFKKCVTCPLYTACEAAST